MQLTFLIVISVITSFSAACITQSGADGECINIKKCRPIMRLLKRRPPLKVYEELRKERCGFDGDDPKICCKIEKQFSPVKTKTPTSVDSPSKFRLLDHDICGPVSTEPRIYGGTKTRIFEFPWMALLAYDSCQKDDRPDFRCGATIINKHYIMTAAHCVVNLPEYLKFIGVRVGEYNLAKEKDCEIYPTDNGAAYICAEKYQEFDVEQIFAHPDYSTVTLQNDIALIRINGTINFKPASVRPICLPLDKYATSLSLKTAQVAGWGSTEDGSPMSDVLLKVKVALVNNEVCVKAYRDQPLVRIGNGQLCAGGGRYRDSCTGDSGGPLMALTMYRGHVRNVQFGIVSFGRRTCAVQGSPGVYTNVAFYVDWILDVIEE